jgi:hypothetical protein
VQLPNVIHPRVIDVNGVLFRVASYSPLTDIQAANVVRHFLSGYKLRKKDKGKTITIHTVLDQESAGLFG